VNICTEPASGAVRIGYGRMERCCWPEVSGQAGRQSGLPV
jgi:hypothetical protein